MGRTVPVSNTQAPGNFVTGALWNAGPAASNTFLTTVPMAILYQNTVQALTNNNWTSITFDSSILDTDSQHSNVTNPSRFTCQVPGVYEFSGGASFASSATGIRGATWAKNGTILSPGVTSLTAPVSGNTTSVTMPLFAMSLSVGDYVEMQLYQSAGSLNTNNGQYSCAMIARWVHS